MRVAADGRTDTCFARSHTRVWGGVAGSSRPRRARHERRSPSSCVWPRIIDTSRCAHVPFFERVYIRVYSCSTLPTFQAQCDERRGTPHMAAAAPPAAAMSAPYTVVVASSSRHFMYTRFPADVMPQSCPTRRLLVSFNDRVIRLPSLDPLPRLLLLRAPLFRFIRAGASAPTPPSSVNMAWPRGSKCL